MVANGPRDAVVLIGEGTEPDVRLTVTGVVERRIGLSKHDLDGARPGSHIGYEIARGLMFRVIHILGLVSGAGALQNAEPLGNGDKLSQGLHFHFFHDHLPMRLDRALAAAKFARGMLVCLTAHDDLEHLLLARGQG